ncbi:MAG: hypothetical protein ACLGJD_23725, partial [Gammaproteobacteria bacterium]
MIRRLLLIVLAALVLLAAALGINTWRQGSRQIAVAPAPKADVDLASAAQRLAGAVRFRTISAMDGSGESSAEFDKFQAYLAQQFPRVHGALRKE